MLFKLLAYFLLAVSVSACTVIKVTDVNEIKKAISEEAPEKALKILNTKKYAASDLALYNLEKGSLLKILGKQDESTQAFEAAKIKIDDLYTTSISKSVGSVLINDTVSAYEGDTFEYIMLHIYQALNYLEKGQLENAGVIARQLDVKLAELEDKKRDSKASVYKCDPYANYLSGIIFERLQDWNSARVTYEKSYHCYKNSLFKLPVPAQLKSSLLKAAKFSGAENIYQRYKKSFNADVLLKDNYNGELIFVLDEGFIANKIETSAIVTASGQNKIRQLKISLPKIPDFNPHLAGQVRIKANKKIYFAEKIQDLDSATRASLNERLPAIKARTIARAIKNQAIQNTAEQNGNYLAQFGSLVLTHLLERADVRGWDSLPHTVWLSRLKLKDGVYDIEIELLDKAGVVLTQRKYTNIKVKNNSITNLYMRWATGWPYQYRKKSVVIIPVP